MDNKSNNSVAHDSEISATSSFKYDPKACPIWEITADYCYYQNNHSDLKFTQFINASQ